MTQLRTADRAATADEQAVLARWSGWGAVPRVFDEHLDTYAAARAELRELLTKDGYDAASRTVLNAHYTDGALVRVMWQALQHLGFDEGDVLEPGCGSGHFLGMAPPGARMVGVERDPTSADIATHLYPQARVVAGSFADLDADEASFDAVLGNVPFGSFWVHDPRHNPARHSLHNHFLIKALHLTRPGGLVVALTSRYTLDARNPAARREMAQLADLVAAVRLPTNAHRRAAGTAVVTDLLILRRREPDRPPTDPDSWEWAVPHSVTNAADSSDATSAEGADTTMLINQYFLDHPERVLGEFRAKFVPDRGTDLEVVGDPEAAPALEAALERIIADARERGHTLTPPTGPQTARPASQVDLIDPDAALYAGFLAAKPDGTFTRRVGKSEEPYTPPPAQAEELRQLLQIRDLAMALVTAEGRSLDDTAEIRDLRTQLNTTYDGYVATYGPPSRYTQTRTMLAGWAVFKRWCTDHDPTNVQEPLPASPDTVRAYLTHLRDAGVGADILTKHLDGIAKAHQTAHDKQVEKVLDQIARGQDAATRERAALVAAEHPDQFLFTTATADLRLDPAADQAGREVIAGAEQTTPDEVDLDELGLRTTTIKRPPQGGFRDDPFAGVVRALEVFDPASGTARKEDIFTQRVINPPRPRLGADTAEEALSICLDTHSRVDLDEIARLLGATDPAQARAELGELVFDDPDTDEVVWAPLYLSGNVRRKLARAREAADADARFAVNVTALERVVPADLGPSDVVVQLGSWVEPKYVQQFLRELLQDQRVRVERPLPSIWTVSQREFTYQATDVWGTERMDAYQLTELLLLGDEIRVTDEEKYVQPDGTPGKRQVLNVEATEIARDKAAAIGDRFSAWVWEDTDRAAALMRRYNDLFNSELPTDFSTAALSLPGLSTGAPSLREHQIAAIGRMIYQDGVGLIHDVGAGKTLEIIVGVMERRRRGLTNKSVIVVRNDSIGEQFEKQWRSAYPSAQILIATSDDFTVKKGVDKRAEFVGRVTTGSWDAIIITKDAFQRIPLSADTQREFIQRELDDIKELRRQTATGLSETAAKKTEQALAAAEERLTARLSDLNRDTAGVSFEQTGVDLVVVDEAQDFKNGLVLSRLPDLGIPGSDRAIDLDLKLQWLAERHQHSCAVLATATPFTGKFSEVYLWLRRLGHDLAPFDEWARNFIVADSFTEITPSGALRPKIRMRRMISEADLWTILRLTSDVRMADALTIPGLPQLREGGVEIVTVPASVEARIHSLELGRRERAIRNKPNKRPKKGADNHLVINHHGMQAALDLRTRGITTGEPQKVDVIADDIHREHLAAADNVYRAADGTDHPVRGGLILAFCDESIPRPGWNFYQELKDHLVARGMREDSVRFIHEATTPQAKRDLYAACRDGGVSVLIGSTQRMGAGLNVQDRLLGGYEIIPPRDYRADTSHQARGRVIRQGNQNETVFWKRVVLAPSLDAKKWEIVRQKHDLFAPLLAAQQPGRHRDVDDNESIDLADVMAAATGDPRYTEKAELDQEFKKLTRLQAGHTRAQQAARLLVTDIEKKLPAQRREIQQAEQVATRHVSTRGTAFSMTVQGTTVTKRTEAAHLLNAALRHEISATPRTRDGRDITVAALGGFTITAQLRPMAQQSTIHLLIAEAGANTSIPLDHRDLPDGHGLIVRLENLLDEIPKRPALLRSVLEDNESTLTQARTQIDAPFPHATRLAEVTTRRAELTAELSEDDDTLDATVDPDSPESKARADRREQRAQERAELAEQVRLTVFEAGGADPHDFAAWYVAIVEGIALAQRPPVLTAHKVWLELGRPRVDVDTSRAVDAASTGGSSSVTGTARGGLAQSPDVPPELEWLAEAAMVSTVATRWSTEDDVIEHLRHIDPLPFYQDLPGNWKADREKLVAEIAGARKKHLSPSGALVAYKAKSPHSGRQDWYVVHTASGAQLGELISEETFDNATADRDSAGAAIILPDAMVPRYLYALEHRTDSDGQRLDWTQGLAGLRTALSGWVASLPVDMFGRLVDGDQPPESRGLRTLHGLAVLNGTASDPLAAALTGELVRITRWVTPSLADTIGQRSVAPLRRALAVALSDRYPPNSGDDKALLAVDQDTSRVLTTTILWGFGADPRQAIDLLTARINALHDQHDPEPTLPASRLHELVLHIAELHTPEPTELERLLRATPGSHLVAGPPADAAEHWVHTWEITGSPERIDGTRGGPAVRLPVTLHQGTGLVHGTLTIDTAGTHPVVINHSRDQPDAGDQRFPIAIHLPALAAGRWMVVDSDQTPPTTLDEVRHESHRAARAYLDQIADRPDNPTTVPAPAADPATTDAPTRPQPVPTVSTVPPVPSVPPQSTARPSSPPPPAVSTPDPTPDVEQQSAASEPVNPAAPAVTAATTVEPAPEATDTTLSAPAGHQRDRRGDEPPVSADGIDAGEHHGQPIGDQAGHNTTAATEPDDPARTATGISSADQATADAPNDEIPRTDPEHTLDQPQPRSSNRTVDSAMDSAVDSAVDSPARRESRAELTSDARVLTLHFSHQHGALLLGTEKPDGIGQLLKPQRAGWKHSNRITGPNGEAGAWWLPQTRQQNREGRKVDDFHRRLTRRITDAGQALVDSGFTIRLDLHDLPEPVVQNIQHWRLHAQPTPEEVAHRAAITARVTAAMERTRERIEHLPSQVPDTTLAQAWTDFASEHVRQTKPTASLPARRRVLLAILPPIGSMADNTTETGTDTGPHTGTRTGPGEVALNAVRDILVNETAAHLVPYRVRDELRATGAADDEQAEVIGAVAAHAQVLRERLTGTDDVGRFAAATDAVSVVEELGAAAHTLAALCDIDLPDNFPPRHLGSVVTDPPHPRIPLDELGKAVGLPEWRLPTALYAARLPSASDAARQLPLLPEGAGAAVAALVWQLRDGLVSGAQAGAVLARARERDPSVFGFDRAPLPVRIANVTGEITVFGFDLSGHVVLRGITSHGEPLVVRADPQTRWEPDTTTLNPPSDRPLHLIHGGADQLIASAETSATEATATEATAAPQSNTDAHPPRSHSNERNTAQDIETGRAADTTSPDGESADDDDVRESVVPAAVPPAAAGDAPRADQIPTPIDVPTSEGTERFGITPQHPAVQHVRESVARVPPDPDPERAAADRLRVAAEAVGMYVMDPDGVGVGSVLRSIAEREGPAEALIPRSVERSPAVEWPHWARCLRQASAVLRTADGFDDVADRVGLVADLMNTRIDALATTPAAFQVKTGAAGVRLLPAGHPAAPPLAHQLDWARESQPVTGERYDTQVPLQLAFDALAAPDLSIEGVAERHGYRKPFKFLWNWEIVDQLRDLADVAEAAGYTTPLAGHDRPAPDLWRALADDVAAKLADRPRYEPRVRKEVPELVPTQPLTLFEGDSTSPVDRAIAEIIKGTAHNEDAAATHMAARTATELVDMMVAHLSTADQDRVRRAAAAVERGANDEAMLHLSWSWNVHRTFRRGVTEAWDVLHELLWPQPGWDLPRIARFMVTHIDHDPAQISGALVALAAAWRACSRGSDDLARLLNAPPIAALADQLETVADHLATHHQFTRPSTPRVRMTQASLFDVDTSLETEKPHPPRASGSELAVPHQLGKEAFDAAVAEAGRALADTAAAGGHHPDAWLQFSEMTRTDPRTGISYSATQPEWQAVSQWWIQQATTALDELGYRVEMRAAEGRRRYREHQIDVDRAAQLIIIDAALPAGTNAFNLVKQVAVLRAETYEAAEEVERDSVTPAAAATPPRGVDPATDSQIANPDSTATSATNHAIAGTPDDSRDGLVDTATPVGSDDSGAPELSIEEIYEAEGYPLIDGLTDTSGLLTAQHWELVEEQQTEIFGAYTEHWRRHDVSLGVTITPEDRVLTRLFIRHGPWESPAWHEFETDSAQLVRDLVQQAGLHGVARPARLPGLWRVESVSIAADASTVGADNPAWRLATRPADADTEDSWVFADDSTPVPLAPPLPQIAVATRNDVIKYILGDRHADTELRRQVQVVLSGRTNKGLYLADAQRQLHAKEPEVYRRALTAAAGRPTKKGEQFDVARAQQALERLAEGDPTLPLNSIGQYVEISEPDPEAERVPLVGPMPTRAVRGVVVEVIPEHGNQLRVVIERDVTSVTGAPRALQDFPVDGAVTCLDPTQRPNAEELRAAREAMVPAIREHQQSLGIDTTATASADAGNGPAASAHTDTATQRHQARSAQPEPSDSPAAPQSPKHTATTHHPSTAHRSESTSDDTRTPTIATGAPTQRTDAPRAPADRRQPSSPQGSGMVAAALAWWDAGCSVVQVRANGSKRPVGDSWTRFQQERASREEVTRWFDKGHPGIGIVCGAVSGDLEMFELEGRAVHEHLGDALRERMITNGHADLWERLSRGYVERSPSGGVHVLYRVEGGVDRNTKLAQREARDDELTDDERIELRDKGVRARRVLIETRGEGGFVVVAPSHGPVHDSGHPWRRLAGAPARIPTITADERDALHMAARDLDQIPAPPPIPDPAPRPDRATEGLRPGDDFNERATWREVLEPHGWVAVGGDAIRTYWRRPGKNTGQSAVSGGDRGDFLWVFSTSTALPSEQALSKWRTYGLLDHAGDFSAAARALSAAGYGDRVTPTPSGTKPAAGAPASRASTGSGNVRRPGPPVPRQHDHQAPEGDSPPPSTADHTEQTNRSSAPGPHHAAAALVPHVLNTIEAPQPGDADTITLHPEIHTADDLSPLLRVRENRGQAGWLPLATAVGDSGHQLHIATQSLAQVRGAIRRLWPVVTSYGLGVDAALDLDTVADAGGAGVIVHLPRMGTLDRDTTAVVAALKGFRVHSDPIPGTTPIFECVSHRHAGSTDLAVPPERVDSLDTDQRLATTSRSSPSPTVPVLDSLADGSAVDVFSVASSRVGLILERVDPAATQTATELLAQPGNRERAMHTIWAAIPIIDARFPTPVVEIVRDVVVGVARGEHVDTDGRARTAIAEGQGLPAATMVTAVAMELDWRRGGDDPLAAVLQQTDASEIVTQLHAIADGMAVYGGFEVPGRPSQHALFAMPDTSARPAAPSTARLDASTEGPFEDADEADAADEDAEDAEKTAAAEETVAAEDADAPAASAVNEAADPEAARTTSTATPASSHDETGTRDDRPTSTHRGTHATVASSPKGAPASPRSPQNMPSRPVAADDAATGEPADGSDAGAFDPTMAEPGTSSTATSPPPAPSVALAPAVATLRTRLSASHATWPRRLDAFLVATDPFAAQDALRAITRATDNNPHVQALAAMAWRAQHGQATTAEINAFVDRLTTVDPTLVGNAVGRNVRDPRTGQLLEIQEIRADIEGRVVLRGTLADRTVLTTAVDPDAWLDPRGSEILPAADAFALLDRWTQLCEQARRYGYTVVEHPNSDVVRHDAQRIEVGAGALAERVTRLADLVENVTAVPARPSSTSAAARPGPEPADPAATGGTHPPSTVVGEASSSTPRTQVDAPATPRQPGRPPQHPDAIDRIDIVAADDPDSEPLADQLAMSRHTGKLRIDEPARLAISYVHQMLHGPAEDAAFLAQTVINVSHRGEAEQIAARLTKFADKIDAAGFTTPITGGTTPIAAHLRDIATHVLTRLTAAPTPRPSDTEAAIPRPDQVAAVEAGAQHNRAVQETASRASGDVTKAQHLTQRPRTESTSASAPRRGARPNGRQQPGTDAASNDRGTPRNGDRADRASREILEPTSVPTTEPTAEPESSEPHAEPAAVAGTPAAYQTTSSNSPRRRASIPDPGDIAWPTIDPDLEPSPQRAATEIGADPSREPASPGSPAPIADNTGTDRADHSVPPGPVVPESGTTAQWVRLVEQASRAGYAVVTIYDATADADVDDANRLIRISGDHDPVARVVALARVLGQMDAAGLRSASLGALSNAATPAASPRPSAATHTTAPHERGPHPSPRRAVAYESVEVSSPVPRSETPVFDALVRELGWHDFAASLDESRQRRAVAYQPAIPQPVAPSQTPLFDRLMHKLGWYDGTGMGPDTVDRTPAPNRNAQPARHRPAGNTRRPQPPDDLAAVAATWSGRRSYAAVGAGIDTGGTRGRNGR